MGGVRPVPGLQQHCPPGSCGQHTQPAGTAFQTIRAHIWIVWAFEPFWPQLPFSSQTWIPFYLKHLGISLLLLLFCKRASFTCLELWGRFLPSQIALSYGLEGILHPCVMLQPFVGLVPLKSSLSLQALLPNHCAPVLLLTLCRMVLKVFLLAIGSSGTLKNDFQARQCYCFCFVIIFVVSIKSNIWQCALVGREPCTQLFLLWLTYSFSQ